MPEEYTKEQIKKAEEKIEWAWMESDGLKPQGPFESKEKAIQDTIQYYIKNWKLKELDSFVYVGPISNFNPILCMPDACQIIEWASENAYENNWLDFGELLETEDKAIEELGDFLKYWTNKYIKTERWTLNDDDCEKIDLTDYLPEICYECK